MSVLRRCAVGVGGVAVAAVALLPAGTASADGCVNAGFRTGPSAGLPDCRAYEQVSAIRKFGNAVWALPPTVTSSTGQRVPGWASVGGERMLFNAVGGAGADNALRGYQFPQVAERSADGWSQRPVIDGPPNDRVLTGANALPRMQIPAVDSRGLLFGAFMPFSPLQPDVVTNDGNGGIHLAGTDGAVAWLSNPITPDADLPPGTGTGSPDLPPGASPLNGTKFAPVGVSDDGSTAYFMTRQTVTPTDVTSGRTWDQAWALYKVKNGVLSNAGTLPDGTVAAAGSMSAGLVPSSNQTNTSANFNFSSTLGAVNVVSPDGDRALFVGSGNASTPGQLYLHRGGQSSLLISKPPADSNPVVGTTGVVPLWGFGAKPQDNSHNAAASGRAIATADRDLGVVYFATRDGLLPGNPSDGTRVNTYRYEVATNQLEYLAELDRPGSAATINHHGNVYGVSDDGSRLLFWTSAGELKLWRDGASTLTLATGLETSGDTSLRGVRFSDDGRTVVFMSTRPINGEPSHPAGNGPAQTQVYRFEEGVDLAPLCISCPPPAAAEQGPATFDLQTPINAGFGFMGNDASGLAQARGTSADGRRVYFTTTSTLDASDQNAVADVYQWSADTGLALISSGSPESRGEGLLDVDATGDNVFFVSEQRLTASDTDGIFDVYVARVGGGFPDPPPFDTEPSCVLPNQCQPIVPPGPPLPGPGSGVVAPVTEGAKDLGRPAIPAKLAVRRTRASRTRVTLGVKVPGAGTIRVTGKTVRNVSRRTTRETTYTVHARLSKATKRRIDRRGSARVTLRVRFTPREGEAQTKTVKVTVKRAAKTSRRGR